LLPVETRIEIRRRLPATSTGKPPLVFVHGGYCDAWCWEPYFLPWFASKGYPAYALSLRGHGKSGGSETLFVTGIEDYEADVEHVAGLLDEPAILIGHSLGAAVVERILARRPVRGAALLGPVPPTGLLPVATRLASEHPKYLVHMSSLDPSRLSADVLEALKPFYLTSDVPPKIIAEFSSHLTPESPRVLFDLSLRLHWVLPQGKTGPVFVLGGGDDRISAPDDVRATAAHHGVGATILPHLGHMMMLEVEWELAARALEAWLRKLR
jgi:non-heme chloroperoxidase